MRRGDSEDTTPDSSAAARCGPDNADINSQFIHFSEFFIPMEVDIYNIYIYTLLVVLLRTKMQR